MDMSGGVGPSPHFFGDDPLIADPAFTAHMLAGMPGIVFLYDALTGKSLYQNRALSSLLGYDAAAQRDMAGREWRTLMHPEDIERFATHRALLQKLKPGEQASFEYRVCGADGAYRWLLGRDTAYDGPGRRPGLIIGNAVDIDAQKRAEQRLDLLMHEFGHRVNNMHMMVSAIVTATYRAGGGDFLKTVDGRLRALARGNAVLIGKAGPVAELPAMIEQTFAPYAPGARLSTDGPVVRIAGGAAANLSLALNELATNAVKYGALSVADGRIAIGWTCNDALVIVWRESGGPPVAVPSRKGFGSRLIVESLSGVGGTVALDWAAEGLCATLTLPADAIAAD